MVRAQEFVIELIENSKDTYDIVEEKSGVSKSTVSRLVKGHTVTTQSLRRIARAYGKEDEFILLVSESADLNNINKELRELFERSERVLTESYEDRIRSLNTHIKTLQASQREMQVHYEARLEHMDRIHDKERALDEEHFQKERFAWDAVISRADERIARLQKNNVYLVIALGISAVMLMVSILVPHL